MSRRINTKYTIFVSRTGESPLVFSMPSGVFFGRVTIALGILSLPFLWAGSIWLADYYRSQQYIQERIAIQQRQEQLQNEQEQLQQEIERLKERAGIPKITPSPEPQLNSPRGRGGGDPDKLMQSTRGRLNNLWTQLRELNPSLEATLYRESVIPQGVPMQGNKFVITSGFGNRANPFGGGSEFHNGVDFVDAYGSPVYATGPGLVTTAGWDGGYGQMVTITHSYGYSTLYAHLSGIVVKQNTWVQRGQLIGYLGNSGRSTGPHLHYSVYQGEKAVDPRQYLKLTDQEYLILSKE